MYFIWSLCNTKKKFALDWALTFFFLRNINNDNNNNNNNDDDKMVAISVSLYTFILFHQV